MKKFLAVTSVLARIKFLEQRVENYFNNRRQNNKILGEKLSKDFENIAFSSLHTMGQGSVLIGVASHGGKVIRCVEVSTSTYFLVTGIKAKGGEYRMTFAASMS